MMAEGTPFVSRTKPKEEPTLAGTPFASRGRQQEKQTTAPDPDVIPKIGNLSPELDAKARAQAKQMASEMVTPDPNRPQTLEPEFKSRGMADVALAADSAGLGLPQKVSGLIGGAKSALGFGEGEGFSEGREYGEVVHEYFLEEARRASHFGRASELAGSLMTPPILKGGKFLQVVGDAAISSGIETAARQTPSEFDASQIAAGTAVGGATAGALDAVGRGIVHGLDKPEKGLTPRQIKGKQIQEVAESARESFDVPGDRAGINVKGAEFRDSVSKETDRLKSSGKNKINTNIEAQNFEIGTPRPFGRTQEQITEDMAKWQRELGPDKTMELTNTIGEIQESLSEIFTREASGASRKEERELIVETLSDEFPDMAADVKKWAGFMDELDDAGEAAANAITSINPKGQLNMSIRGKNYEAVAAARARATGQEELPVTVNPEATPGAWRLREILSEDSGVDTNITLKYWDDLQHRIQGLKRQAEKAGNGPDKRAIEDMEIALHDTVNSMIAREDFVGDKARWTEYNIGKGLTGQAKAIRENKVLARMMDEGDTGSNIAQQFFKVTNAKQGSRAAKDVAALAKNLGEDSPALASLRAGILAETFAEGRPSEILKRVEFLTSDPDLISMFPPEVADQLTELATQLHTIDTSNVSKAADVAADYLGPALEFMAHKVAGARGASMVRQTGKLTGPLSAAGGTQMLTGSPLMAGTAFVGSVALQQLAREPVRRAIGGTARATARGVGRDQAGVEMHRDRVDQYIPEGQMLQDAYRRVLGGPQ